MEAGLHFASASDLFEAFPTAAEDMTARPAHEPPLQFLASLRQSPTPEEAITFAAYLLPRRKAVWWGHECLRSQSHLLSPEDLQMLALAELWVREPEEPHRADALEQAMASRGKPPGAWIALAAGWSGGSLAPPDQPRVPPPPYLTARAVNIGILGALARVDGRQRAATLGSFVDMAASLATR